MGESPLLWANFAHSRGESPIVWLTPPIVWVTCPPILWVPFLVRP